MTMTTADDVMRYYLLCARELGLEYENDPMHHMWVEVLRLALTLAEGAMTEEGLDEAARGRVLNTVIWGHPNSTEEARRMAHRVRLLQDPQVTQFRQGFNEARWAGTLG